MKMNKENWILGILILIIVVGTLLHNIEFNSKEDSVVALSVKEEGENYKVKNEGNVKTNLDWLSGSVVGAVVLDVNQEIRIKKENVNITGEQDKWEIR